MNDDSYISEEYTDYSKVPRRDFGLDDKDRQLYKELNKIRYKFDRGYISADNFFKQIDCPEFYTFLNEYEWSEINKRTEEKKQRRKADEEERIRKSELKKAQSNDWNIFLFVIVIIYILIILIMS